MVARTRAFRWTTGLALVLITVIGLSAAGPALGHAFLESSDPAEDAVLTAMPSAVRLQFSEPVEVNASIFKVYPLPHEDDPLRLKAVASQRVTDVLLARRDEDQRADAGLSVGRGIADDIQILLKEDLAPGPYVVMWRVLSVDTHVTQGFFVFRVLPDGGDA